jgi:hypothetical protein
MRESATSTAGLIQFYSCCRPQVSITANDINRKALLCAFLYRVDALVEKQRYPNQATLSVAGISLEGLFVEDIPEVEIWTRAGCIYKSSSSGTEPSSSPGKRSPKNTWDYDDVC